VLLLLAMLAGPAHGHGQEHAGGAQPAAAAQPAAPAEPTAPAAPQQPTSPASPAPLTSPAPPAASPVPTVTITPYALAHHATSHLHNKLVHLPVGLAFGLVALSLLPGPLLPGQVLAAIGALAALASLYTGTVQGADYAREVPTHVNVVSAHRASGWVSTVAWALAAGGWFFPGGARGLRIAVSALALAAVLVAGLFGGWLAAG
jgi:hypothetical protein